MNYLCDNNLPNNLTFSYAYLNSNIFYTKSYFIQLDRLILFFYYLSWISNKFLIQKNIENKTKYIEKLYRTYKIQKATDLPIV